MFVMQFRTMVYLLFLVTDLTAAITMLQPTNKIGLSWKPCYILYFIPAGCNVNENDTTLIR